jgi:hypothetical protein
MKLQLHPLGIVGNCPEAWGQAEFFARPHRFHKVSCHLVDGVTATQQAGFCEELLVKGLVKTAPKAVSVLVNLLCSTEVVFEEHFEMKRPLESPPISPLMLLGLPAGHLH